MNDKSKKLEQMRHSCAHLLAAAVLELWPDTKPTIGPAIENGFYYDFEFINPISEEDLPKIEKEMLKLLPKWINFQKREVNPNEAKKVYKNNPYKLELIDEIEKKKEKITFYKAGSFEDLCRGGHCENPSKEIGTFKLLSIAGAYWRGSEKNKMLTRIYGTCFPSQKELNGYLNTLEEAKKRDHRKIGRELDLFSFHEEGPGFVFWHPKGMLIRESFMEFHSELHKEAKYQLVSTPILLSEDLWHKSGHWDNYKDKMYFTKVDNKTFAIKPMNCPGAILIYKNKTRSYKDLPIRFAEAGEVHRHEPSGTLHGLFRARAFRQDDAHIFVREDQIEKEVKEVIKLTLNLYKAIGFEEVNIELSTRPAKSIGSDEVWEKSENALKKILKDLNISFKINQGDGAFYGPKIDFHIKDSLSRSWQCGTVQLDFSMPERFGIQYIDKDGQAKQPVMIHRTVIGSIQRFMGILIEHFAGKFPLWLAPVQVIVMPITDKQSSHAKKLTEELKINGVRAELDNRPERLQAKIRDGSLQKVPYLGIIGDKEIENNSISVRTREGKDLGQLKFSDFSNKLKEEIDKKI